MRVCKKVQILTLTLLMISHWSLAYSAATSFSIQRINDKGKYVARDYSDLDETQRYKESVKLIGKTWNYIRDIDARIKAKDFEGALKIFENVYDGEDDVNFDVFSGMVGDDFVKILYLKGDLRNAIRQRWRLLLHAGKDGYHNDLIELNYLKEEYRKQVGEDKYAQESIYFPHEVDLDEEFIKWRLKHFMAKGFKYELYKHELMAREYFIRGHYHKAVESLNAELAVLKANKRAVMSDSWWRLGERIVRENLLYAYVLMGKYDDAKIQAQWQLKYSKDLKKQSERTLKALDYAIQRNLSPLDLGYISEDHQAVLVVRDKNYNRLKTNFFGPKDEMVKPLIIHDSK